MSTYGEMQTRIASECVATGEVAAIKDVIQTAIQFYEARRFTFNKGYMTFPTVAGATAYGAATNADIPLITRILVATVGGNGWAQDLESCTYEEIFESLAEGGNVIPTHIVAQGGELLLAPPAGIRELLV